GVSVATSAAKAVGFRVSGVGWGVVSAFAGLDADLAGAIATGAVSTGAVSAGAGGAGACGARGSGAPPRGRAAGASGRRARPAQRRRPPLPRPGAGWSARWTAGQPQPAPERRAPAL